MLESVKDLEYIMGWELQPGKKKKQTQLFVELNAEEKKITEILEQRGKLDIDTISIETKLPTGKLAGILLNLEFSGVLNSLPGKVYELI